MNEKSANLISRHPNGVRVMPLQSCMMWSALGPAILVLLLHVIFPSQTRHHATYDVKSRDDMADESSTLGLSSPPVAAELPCESPGVKHLCTSVHGRHNLEMSSHSGNGGSLTQDILDASGISKKETAPEYSSLDGIPFTDDITTLGHSFRAELALPFRTSEDVKQIDYVNGVNPETMKDTSFENQHHTLGKAVSVKTGSGHKTTKEHAVKTFSNIIEDHSVAENAQAVGEMLALSQHTAATRVTDRGQYERSISKRLPPMQTSPTVTENGVFLSGVVVNNVLNKVSSLETKKQGRQSEPRVHAWKRADGEANAMTVLNSLRLEQNKREKIKAKLLHEERRRAEELQKQRLEILKNARRLRRRRYVADCGLIVGRDFWRSRCWTFWSWGS